MRKLKPRQQELLDEIIRNGRVPADHVDGRVLRPLRSAGLVQILGDQVEATADGRRHARPKTPRLPVRSKLNDRQEELLRSVVRVGRIPVEEIDGRVARPLMARGLVTMHDDIVAPTSAGRTYFETHSSPSPRRRGARVENPRATAIRRAARQLEVVIPLGSEVLVGNIMASADDLVDAFRRHARKLDTRSD